jgi:hypothetical protein
LRKLAALINRILSVVKGCGGNAIVKYDDKGGKLVVWKADGETMLPKNLYSKWDDKGKSEDIGVDSTKTPVDRVENKGGKSIE